MQLSGPHDGMTFRISTERWVSFLKKGEIYCMIEAQGCGLERPRLGRWVPEQGTWDVWCGKCPVGRPTGAERPRKKDAGTTAEGWYEGRSSVRWTETAMGWDSSDAGTTVKLVQRQEFRTRGQDSSELRRQWVKMAVGQHTKEVTFLQNDMVDLILSAGPSDPCFEEFDDHPTEDRTTSSECKTILNNSPELDQELGWILTTALHTAPKQSGNGWPTNYRLSVMRTCAKTGSTWALGIRMVMNLTRMGAL